MGKRFLRTFPRFINNNIPLTPFDKGEFTVAIINTLVILNIKTRLMKTVPGTPCPGGIPLGGEYLLLLFIHKGISVIFRGEKVFLDGSGRYPAQQVDHGACFIVGARCP